jgi:hypothetical protein
MLVSIASTCYKLYTVRLASWLLYFRVQISSIAHWFFCFPWVSVQKPAYDVEMVGITLDQAMITSVEPARRLTEEETMQQLKEGREALGMTNDYASGCVASANSKDDPIPSPCP